MAWNQVSNIKGPKGDAGVQGIQGTQGPAGTAADIAILTHAAVSKTTPVDADELPLIDSAASWGLKRLTWANLKAALQSLFFHRGNILGTVSQASGVPTGAIVQRGSNANGEFVRFADGTQICNRRWTLGAKDWAALESITLGSWLYPAVFIASPTVSAQNDSGYGGVFLGGIENARDSRVDIVHLRSLANSALGGVNNTVNLTAVGRWF